MSASQCDRVLAVLKDGRKHTMEEIHQHAGFMRLNSRISDLRKRGHTIECSREDGYYVYQLRALDEVSGSDSVLEADLSDSAPEASSSAPAAASAPFAVHPTLTAASPPVSVEEAGALTLFACEIDESAGLRGAYGNEAA